MDGIQPYAGPPRTPSPFVAPISPAVTKTPSNYLRALRRRVWLVLAISVPLSILASVGIAFMPNVFSAKAQIVIEPPEFDPVLSTIISRDVGPRPSSAVDTYVPNRIAMLRSRALADRVLNDPSLTQGNLPAEDAADELIATLQSRQMPGTNVFTIMLEGHDPARTTKQLQLLIDAFQDQASSEIVNSIDENKGFAESSLKQLEAEWKGLHDQLYAMLKNSDTIGPNGKNIKQIEYETLTAILLNDQYQLTQLQTQAWQSQLLPNLRAQPGNPSLEQRIVEYEMMQDKYTDQLELVRRRTRSFNTDPAAKHLSSKLHGVLTQLDRLRALRTPTEPENNAFEVMLQSKKEDIEKKAQQARVVLTEMQQSMPAHQQYLDLLEKLKTKGDQIAEMQKNIWSFNAISKSRKDPIRLIGAVVEPTVPIRPRRAMNVVMAIGFCFGLGIGLVCLLEHVDHSVKEPEHLMAGLTLPLFGVIPRIRRTAQVHRGGHLWTPGAPESIEADAYRNLRASLLGLSDKRGPIVTLLVTSAKAGEGKSTTALNLAATCARAGERTLLLDVDLRRPSLAGVFQNEDDEGYGLGLVDVLRGDLPWQRTVVRTDISNLDFLPTGDTAGIPIEILGTRELRQLLIGLSSHYDRVILDGPAILGLADCRMLGRVVDASILVVRSGSQELRPLQHAKAMLEQSHVVIAGVVFNGLYEDLKNWSSYGPETPYGYTGVSAAGLSASSRGLSADDGPDSGDEEQSALPLTGSLQS